LENVIDDREALLVRPRSQSGPGTEHDVEDQRAPHGGVAAFNAPLLAPSIRAVLGRAMQIRVRAMSETLASKSLAPPHNSVARVPAICAPPASLPLIRTSSMPSGRIS